MRATGDFTYWILLGVVLVPVSALIGYLIFDWVRGRLRYRGRRSH